MKEFLKNSLPHAREDELIIREVSDEVLIYDLRRHRAYCLNQTAALIWQCCDGKTPVVRIKARLERELKKPADEELIRVALERFDQTHLLRERLDRSDDFMRFTRRDLMKKVGKAAAVAVPVVTSIIVPTAAQAATLIGPSQCNSGDPLYVGRCCSNNKICLAGGNGCAGAAC
ncbi:MAG TPA: PqqD family protein [Blastocatellia bacterium]|nr:PqqD family protein [Blastocatellia bacterium]